MQIYLYPIYRWSCFGLMISLLTGCSAVSQSKNSQRTIYAEVVALDQPITYNRFGSFNPYGMIYALKRDVIDTETCDGSGKNCKPMNEQTKPGHVRLRDGKRPRPLVLRVNEGDRLQVKFYNMLLPHQPDISSQETKARLPNQHLDSIKSLGLNYRNLGTESEPLTLPAEAATIHTKITGPAGNPALAGKGASKQYCGWYPQTGKNKPDSESETNWPRSRCSSITISGVAASNVNNSEQSNLQNGLIPIPPGESIVYQWQFDIPADQEHVRRRQTYLFFSHGAPAGGEGDGGSLVHGLFGAVNVEPAGSRWYRSQVTADIWKQIWQQNSNGHGRLNYETTLKNGFPALNLLKPLDNNRFELIYGDLNAIIMEDRFSFSNTETNPDQTPAFREFTVIFHDELKTFYADEFTELGSEFSLAGVADGFAINYGASGMGSLLLANRKGIGPSKNCVECAYEEFFLESWVNGDPALLADYADDPSNVHHSYLNDRVVFRNLHAGPKETHVFHLHAHQWLAEDKETGTYLDSQTIAPQQGFSYQIYYGGSGNRNETPGDSIFHCHLYPHFAQGMWELWRVHDVLEDGTRRLPDGEFVGVDGKSGTNPDTGEIPPLAANPQQLSGTPIPAVIPLPEQAMPPEPTYLEDGVPAKLDGFPGYPFYIAGESGHRSPQAPLDIHESAGLGRHVVQCPKDKQGNSVCRRTVSGIASHQLSSLSGKEVVKHALQTADFSVELEDVQIKLLPPVGTELERIAMNFHSQGEINSKTPQGDSAKLSVNDSDPKPGAPYADPCRGWTFDEDTFGDRTRRYHVSAIQTDMVVNHVGWHDPQARINVLDDDVDEFENQRTKHAVPFFFRAHSGDCIEFYHTNRTHKELEVDDFQVKTPTDTIGQHIHLVKFDVTASDGSGNGFNYEDGTFSQGAIIERIHAAEGKVVNTKGESVQLEEPAPDQFQTTIQRWYADPLLARNKECKKLAVQGKPGWKSDPDCFDRTMRTVFTHDHFAPSSIQQHGFYSALLVEPKNAKLQYPDGTDMDAENDKTNCKPGEQVDGVFKSCAVGTQAMVIINDDGTQREAGQSYREFALAIADFALLYDGNTRITSKGLKDYDKLSMDKQKVFAKLHDNLKDWQSKNGRPIDPPKLPEAISKDHHNPYLVNYKHEPIPLRIGCKDYKDNPSNCVSDSIKQQQHGDKGDMAYAFSSIKHGDPATEIFAGYEGEKVQLRVIQGAQEVQHMLNIHGQRWPREIGNPESPLVAAQEIGISEHFEMKLGLDNVFRGEPFADSLYNFGSVDDLWNGAWGLIRNFGDYRQCDDYQNQADKRKCETGLASLDWCKNVSLLQDCLKPLPNVKRSKSGEIVVKNKNDFMLDGEIMCPKNLNGSHFVTFFIDTVDVSEWLGDEIYYDKQLYDPDSLAFILLDRKITDTFESPRKLLQADPVNQGKNLEQIITAYKEKIKSDIKAKGVIEPLVIRANAGDCIQVVLYNHLPENMGDKVGDALMPKIVPLNVEPDSEQASADVTPSSIASLHPQLLAHNVANQDGAAVGFNHELQLVAPTDKQGKVYYWYAGTLDIENNKLVAKPRELGAINLVSFGDVINHPVHGLFGALIIEPKNASYHDPVSGKQLDKGSGVRAEIHYLEWGKNKTFKEFVVFYRDGLNLHYQAENGQSIPVPDCTVCDDSYDLGEKGINYSSAPFWLRLDQAPQMNKDDEGNKHWFLPDLNAAYFPSNFFTEIDKLVPTPKFSANEGDEVRFRVLQPSGRARQRTFLVYGHDYQDLLPYFGSPHAPLISVGKAITARIDSAKPGHWLYRDGPAQIWSGGAWGVFDVSKR